MNRKVPFTAVTALLAVLTATGIGSVYASNAGENDALAIDSATISLTQAVTTAEQHVGGKASRAEYEQHKGQAMFDVEVVKDKKVMDVKIDPANGKVISSIEDTSEHENGDGEHDGGRDDKD